MGHGGARANSGRKVGSTLEATQEAKKLVQAFFTKNDPLKKASELWNCGNPAVEVKVWQILMEYRFGKPMQKHEGSGESGEFIMRVLHVGE